ncbi:hypothetical protein COCNU_scaffold017525G000010 [Cocos nucifera]|nr:hypothetical protein [Cocos nucifera]
MSPPPLPARTAPGLAPGLPRPAGAFRESPPPLHLRRVDSGGGEKAFDRIYIIQGMAVKPLVVESVEVEALTEAVKEEMEKERAVMVTRNEMEGLAVVGLGIWRNPGGIWRYDGRGKYRIWRRRSGDL